MEPIANSARFNKALMDDYGFYIEDYFNEMIRIERKRTERSKRPFLLLLLEIDELMNEENGSHFLSGITSILLSCTREIDIKGWYKHNRVIGIILPEINENNIDSARSSISQKLHERLQEKLGSRALKKIKFIFYCFPEENGKDSLPGSPNSIFYPEFEKKPISKVISNFLKRTLDIGGSAVALLFLSPLFLIIALLIKISSKGPAIFCHERIGKLGKRFIFLKFRSMYDKNDPKKHEEFIEKFINGKAGFEDNSGGGREKVYKIKNDSRVTPIGRYLRKSSLDELPQFINVLKGDMSLVGPRPPLPYELEKYDLWHRRRVIKVKPGITGLWQVDGRSLTSFDEMVRLDIQYTREWSLWLDIKILLKTPLAVLSGKGAY